MVLDGSFRPTEMGGKFKFALQPAGADDTSQLPSALVLEPFLTISQIAKALQIDRHVVTRLFAHEPGVMCIGSRETRHGKRKYRSFRVPISVFNRVIARLSNK